MATETLPHDRPARRPLRSGDSNQRDPFDEIDGLAPNMGQDVLPHVVTFQGILRNVARTYYVSDEAMQHSWANARFMRNDPGIMECLEQRQRSTALLGWHLEAEDEKDPTQKRLIQEMTGLVRLIPNFLKYRENLLYALWYGKYGVQHRYRWRSVNGRMRVVLQRWKPVNGDKLVFRYDDGTGEYDDDQVGIRVGAGYTAGSQLQGRWKIERFGKVVPTDHGLAYFLEPWERPLVAIHKHMIEDAEYEDPARAGAIHGVGIRNRLYWFWYQKQEALAWMVEYLERSAFGMEIWSYPAGNAQAKAATMKAAQERIGNGRNIVLVPRHPDSDILSTDVKRVEPGMAGVDALDRIIREYFGWQIKRYILGQILTSETASTGLGSGVASIHLDTYLQIIRYDATNLGETLTTDLVKPLLRYNWPQYADMPIRFVIETESPDVEGKLGAWERAYNMGLKIRSRDVAELIGASVSQPGEDTLQSPQHRQAAEQGTGSREQGTGNGNDNGLAKALAGMMRDRYGRLRPGVERIVYDREGKVKSVERYAAWDKDDHPRGQPDNAGQFARKDQGASGAGGSLPFDSFVEECSTPAKGPRPKGYKPKTLIYRPVDDAEASRIQEATGIDVTGFSHAIDQYAVEHILSKHGEADKLGPQELPVTVDDLKAIPQLIEQPDEIASAGKTRHGLEGIRYKKRIDGYLFYLEEVRTGRKTLAATTMWKVKAGAQEKYTSRSNRRVLRPKRSRVLAGRHDVFDRDDSVIIDPQEGEVKRNSREDYRATAPKHQAGWKTIGGGGRVFIDDDGTIEKGCPGLKGEDLDDLGEDEEPRNRRRREHRQEVAEHHGIKGDDLSHAQVEQLEEHPHPETGKDASGRQKASPTIQRVKLAGREYEVKHDGGMWFYRLGEAAGWTAATEGTAAMIEREMGDIPFEVPEAEREQPAGEVETTSGAKINPRTNVGKAILQTAQDWELPPDDLADALDYVWEQRVTGVAKERQRALEAARKRTGLYPSDVKRLKNAGYDHSSAKKVGGRLGDRLARFDEFAQEMAREYPVLNLGDPDDPAADFGGALWEILDEDRARAIPMDHPSLLREAAEMVIASQQYDPAAVLASSYEEFFRRGEVEKYRKWLAERYGKKSAGSCVNA